MNIKFKSLTITFFLMAAISGYAQVPNNKPNDTSLVNFEDQNPVFKLTGEQSKNVNHHLHFYALTGYRQGVDPIVAQFNMNFKAQKDKGTHRIKMYNLSITDMLTYGLTKSNEVILEVKDPSKYRYDPKYGSEEEWLKKNAHCYELLLPENVLKNMNVVRDHLSFLFKVKCGYQKRMVKSTITSNGTDQEVNKEKEVFVITEIN